MSVHEAKAHFGDLLRQVEAGETITVTKHNKPVAVITAANPIRIARKIGAFDGEFSMPDDAFDPMSTEELNDWNGS